MKIDDLKLSQLTVIGLFAVMTFGLSVWYSFGQKPVRADVVSSPTPSAAVAAAPQSPPAETTATSPSPDLTPAPVSPTPSEAASAAPVVAITTALSEPPTNSSPQAASANWRYWLLFADGLIVLGLLFALTLRLLGKVVKTSPTVKKDEKAAQPDPKYPKTIDQLKVDIPL